jgi:hypothetical protein
MTYQANPVAVSAYKILRVAPPGQYGGRHISCEGLMAFWATSEMLARIDPQPGDYVVVQEDGYTYLNPKDVFERKYSPIPAPCPCPTVDPSVLTVQIRLSSMGVGCNFEITTEDFARLSVPDLAVRYLEPAIAAVRNQWKARLKS